MVRWANTKEAELWTKANAWVCDKIFVHGSNTMDINATYTNIIQEFSEFWWVVSEDTKKKVEVMLVNLHRLFRMPNAALYYEILYGKRMEIPDTF